MHYCCRLRSPIGGGARISGPQCTWYSDLLTTMVNRWPYDGNWLIMKCGGMLRLLEMLCWNWLRRVRGDDPRHGSSPICVTFKSLDQLEELTTILVLDPSVPVQCTWRSVLVDVFELHLMLVFQEVCCLPLLQGRFMAFLCLTQLCMKKVRLAICSRYMKKHNTWD